MNQLNPKKLPLIAILFSILFWTVDTAIDVYVLGEEDSYLESMFFPEPAELWMRCLVVVMLCSFSYFARNILLKQQKISYDLQTYQNHLEELVANRTQELENINKSLTEIANKDHLTNLYNRRKFDSILEYEIKKNKRYRLGMSILFCDIDKFKDINDEYGHDIGDKVLTVFASVLEKSLRGSDIVARWGGEEFVILFLNTSEDVVMSLANKIREEIEAHDFTDVSSVTASFGLTHLKDSDDKYSIIKRVDQALYEAKGDGRNCIKLI
ncbi:GGDEF domain-containing protein [Sulfurimonas sp.]|nr:GGDEF domain-containing protein [Sulfurimonas sp.]